MKLACWAALVLSLGSLTFFSCKSDDSPAPPTGSTVDAAADAAGDSGDTCTKVCNGACVSGGDPRTGCNGSSCDPCPSAPHRVTACNEDGVCSAGACDQGFLDCDPAQLGCEVDGRTDKRHCGTCGNACVGVDCVDGKCQ